MTASARVPVAIAESGADEAPRDFRDQALDEIVTVLLKTDDDLEAMQAARLRIFEIAYAAQRQQAEDAVRVLQDHLAGRAKK